jgi:hypothetical protein
LETTTRAIEELRRGRGGVRKTGANANGYLVDEEAGGGGGGGGSGGGGGGDDDWSDDDDDDETSRARTRDHDGAAPKQLAYTVAAAAFGPDKRIAKDVANAWGAVDAAVLNALSIAGKRVEARAFVAAYLLVLHLYMFALLFLHGGGPRATHFVARASNLAEVGRTVG